MRRVALIALAFILVLGPIAAEAQVSIRRLPGQKAVVLKDGKAVAAPRQDDECTEPAEGLPGEPPGGGGAAGRDSNAPAIDAKQHDPRAATAAPQPPDEGNEPRAGCLPAETGPDR